MGEERWFYRSEEEWIAMAERLKQTPCPHCKGVGTLIRHGFLYGFDESSSQRKTVRARRIFCSNRNRRRGCGRTFSVWAANEIRRLSLTTRSLWRFLQRVVADTLAAASGRFDRDGFNDLFRRQLAVLLPRVSNAGRRAGLDAMRTFDFVTYILAALRNAGFSDQQDREQAAHDMVVYLLVSPGQLFAGYNDHSGPLEARFRIAIQNAVRNLIRSRRRREPISRAIGIGHRAGELSAHAIPDHRHDDVDDEKLTAFRAYLADELGEDAVTLLDRRLDGVSLRQLVGDPAFSRSSAWALRRLIRSVRDVALEFARRHGDDEFLAAIERATKG